MAPRTTAPLTDVGKKAFTLARLIEIGQVRAELDGLNYVLIPRPKPSRFGSNGQLAYLIVEAAADAWELAHRLCLITPEGIER